MKDLKGSKTEANLMTAFAGESQARVKYGFYAAQAKKEGYEQISEIFKLTSDNEAAHAKVWFKLLHDGMPATLDNLADCVAGEHYEWSSMYSDFANVARSEGYEEVAVLFEMVAGVEKEHEERYKQLSDNIKQQKVFQKPEKVYWQCRYCGRIHYAESVPEICPICGHPQGYFQIKPENY